MSIIISLFLLVLGLFNAILAVNCSYGDNINISINNKYSIKIPGIWFFGIYSLINTIAAVHIWTLCV